MNKITYFILKDSSFEAKDSCSETLYEKDIDKANTIEKAGLMCSLIAEGLSLKKIVNEYSWSLSLSEFKVIALNDAFIMELYNKSKMARITFMEEEIIEEANKGNEEKVKILSKIYTIIAPSKNRENQAIYNLVAWNADKEDIN